MRPTNVSMNTIPMFPGHRFVRGIDRSRRAASHSQAAIRAKIPKKIDTRINGSRLRIRSAMDDSHNER
jgi:hypothetical protein